MEGKKDVLIAGLGRPQGEQPAAYGQIVPLEVEVPVLQVGRRGVLVVKDLDQVVAGLRQHQRAARLDDPGLFCGDVGPGGTEKLQVVEADVRHDGYDTVSHIGGVPTAPEAHFHDSD